MERIDKAIASRPLPPFATPPPWTAGRHGAGTSVRANGGLFMARWDTEAEPPDESWQPLVVGLAGADMRWNDEQKKLVFRMRLSDGRIIENEQAIALPVVRGYWEPESTYLPGDRVFRFGEWTCLKLSLGVDPTKDESGHWKKVGGKYARDVVFKVDEKTGEMTDNGRAIFNVRKMFAEVVAEAIAKQQAA